MEQCQTGYTWNASDYARNASAQYAWASELIGKLALRGDEQLLDIGCGDGRISAELAKHLSRGGVYGIDASAEMIAEAWRSYTADSFPNLGFQCMDARAIELPQRFDIAFSNAVLHWVDDHSAVLQGVHNALRPGGRMLFQMGGEGNAEAFFSAVEAVTGAPRWRSYFKGFVAPYFFYGISDYERWLPQCGFDPVRIELIPKAMRHSSRESLKGWFRTTWFPYTDRLPRTERECFIEEIIDTYLTAYPPDSEGATTVAMVRLEVEAVTADSLQRS